MAIRSAATSSLLCVVTALIADQDKQGTLEIIGIFLIDDEFKLKTLKFINNWKKPVNFFKFIFIF